MIKARNPHAWDSKDTPFHLDVTAVSDHGGVFHNAMLNAVVVRYRKNADVEEMLRLAEIMMKDSHALCGKLIVCDFRLLEEAALGLEATAVVLHLIRIGLTPALAVLTKDVNRYPVSAEVEAAAVASHTNLQAFHSFEDVARWAAERSEATETWLTLRPKDFRSSYSGSTYTMPDLECTVLRTSGDTGDASLDFALLAHTHLLHKRAGHNTFIFDTTSSPPIIDQQRYADTYKNIILPFMSSGTDRLWIHVRSGDAFMSKDVPPLEPLLKSFNIDLYQVQTLSESVRLLRSIRGLDS